MPRKPAGARLYWRERPGRPGNFVILDTGGIERATGTADRREAETCLAAYIAERDRGNRGPTSAEEMTVDEVLTIYGEEHALTVADPARIGYAMQALLPFWGALPVSAITRQTCQRYVQERNRSAGTARRELGVLQAAVNYCAEAGVLLQARRVTLPPRSQAKDRVVTRDEIARMIRAGRATGSHHVARFILIAYYTGTRRNAVLDLRFDPHPGGGWINLDAGVLYRRAQGAAETAKRQPPVRMPRKLLAHARRWQRLSVSGWVIEFKGARIGSMKTAWRRVCRDAVVEGVTPHTFRHTAITETMRRGVSLTDAAGYFGISVAELERTYLHHHPDFQRETADARDRRA